MNKINLEAFVWPEFSNESKRIKAYSKHTKIFQFRHLRLHYLGPVKSFVNDTPGDVKVGDTMMLNILSISKNHVEFDAANHLLLARLTSSTTDLTQLAVGSC